MAPEAGSRKSLQPVLKSSISLGVKVLFSSMRCYCAAVAMLGVALGFVPAAHSQNLPSLPQAWVDTSYPAAGGSTINVTAGGNLQNAIDAANPGDTIKIQAGATFTGSFTLRAKSGSSSILIRPSALGSTP